MSYLCCHKKRGVLITPHAFPKGDSLFSYVHVYLETRLPLTYIYLLGIICSSLFRLSLVLIRSLSLLVILRFRLLNLNADWLMSNCESSSVNSHVRISHHRSWVPAFHINVSIHNMCNSMFV